MPIWLALIVLSLSFLGCKKNQPAKEGKATNGSGSASQGCDPLLKKVLDDNIASNTSGDFVDQYNVALRLEGLPGGGIEFNCLQIRDRRKIGVS